MYKSQVALYTDVDPVASPVAGRIFKEGDPNGKFLLCGAGGGVSDDIAKKFDLKNHEDFEEHDPVTARADLVTANLATYEKNARTIGGPAYKGIPGAESNPLGVKPDEVEKAQTALDAIADNKTDEAPPSPPVATPPIATARSPRPAAAPVTS